jgi:hypothetical protein
LECGRQRLGISVCDFAGSQADGDIFAGTLEGGGVYRSMDDGENWTLIDNGLTNTYVTALANNGAGHTFAATFWRWGIPFD